ncbi:hypothetical protein MRY87_13715 [bacterium]|nr:hypothetical protein [bacterium]
MREIRFFWWVVMAVVAPVLSASAEVLWSHRSGDFSLRLMEEPASHFHFQIRSDRPFGRSVTVIDEQETLRLTFPGEEIDLRAKSVRALPENPLLTSMQVKKDQIELRFSSASWKERRLRETSSVLVISSEVTRKQFAVEAFASKGPTAPVMQIWNADVKERKVIPIVRVPLTEEELRAEALADEPVLEEDGMPAEESRVGEAPALPIEEDGVKAHLDGDKGISAEIQVLPAEQTVLVGEPIAITLLNEGLGTGELKFQVFEEEAGKRKAMASDLLQVFPPLVELTGGEKGEVQATFSRSSLPEEQVFQVVVFDRSHVDQRGGLSEVGVARIFLQPPGGTARVAWTRDASGITFSNSGNITSIFTGIEVCSDRCEQRKDLYLYPNEERILRAPPEAQIRLTQVVGENRRSGTIPALQ